jgi:hypothetical protein
MAYDAAVAQVNDMKQQLAELARGIISALDDRKVTPMEGMMLGQRGLMFAMTLVTMLQGLPPEQLKGVLYVLEHGRIVLPPDASVQS